MFKALKSGFRALFPACRDASMMQSHALDSRLPVAQRIGLWLHLCICKWCRRYGKQIRFLKTAAQNHSEELTEASPQKLSSESRERIKRRLQAEQ